MTEKINSPGFRPTDLTGSTRRPESSESTTKSGTSAGDVASTGDTVNFSRSSMLLSELHRTVSALKVVDALRVEAMKQAITSGAYEVDSSAVADGMLRLERELS